MEAASLTYAERNGSVEAAEPELLSPSDQRLVALTRKGDQRAFEQIVHRYRPALLRFCRRMLASTEDAEDVLQEVLANSHRAILADGRPIQLRPWLYQIARNRCLNHLRRKHPMPIEQEALELIPSGDGTSTHERVGNREEFRQLIKDVQGLPESQRQALLLREVEGLSYQEEAAAMNTSVAAVRSLLGRARTTLADRSRARELGSAALFPFAAIVRMKNFLLAKLGLDGSSTSSGVGATAAAGSGGASIAGSAGVAGGALGGGLIAKTAAILAVGAVATGGSIGVERALTTSTSPPARSAVQTKQLDNPAPPAAPQRHKHSGSAAPAAVAPLSEASAAPSPVSSGSTDSQQSTSGGTSAPAPSSGGAGTGTGTTATPPPKSTTAVTTTPTMFSTAPSHGSTSNTTTTSTTTSSSSGCGTSGGSARSGC